MVICANDHQVTSTEEINRYNEFVNIYRKHTPNSYDAMLSSRQENKVGVELATKAFQPLLRGLLMKLLNEYQLLVRKSHEDPAAPEMLEIMVAEKQEEQDLVLVMLALLNGTWRNDPEMKKRILQRRRDRGEPHKSAVPGVCFECNTMIEDDDTVSCRSCNQVFHTRCMTDEVDEENTIAKCMDCNLISGFSDSSDSLKSRRLRERVDDAAAPRDSDRSDDSVKSDDSEYSAVIDKDLEWCREDLDDPD